MIARLRSIAREAGIPRLLIAAFVVALFSVAAATHMNLADLVTDSIVRVARTRLSGVAKRALNSAAASRIAAGRSPRGQVSFA